MHVAIVEVGRRTAAERIDYGAEIRVRTATGTVRARQLVLAGLHLRQLRHVFITHHHSDHNVDLGNIILL